MSTDDDTRTDVTILHILARALRGGVEKNCYHFIKASPQFHHDVVVMDNEGPMIDDFKTAGAHTTILNVLGQSRFNFYRDLRRKLPAGRFQKIIVWTNIRMPVIMHALNKYQADIYVHIGNPVGNGWSEWIQSLVLPPTNTIRLRPVSDYVQRGLDHSRYYRKFKSKVSLKPVVMPAITARDPMPMANQSVLNVGMVARLDPIKDHPTVIRAFQLLLDEYPAAVLNLVGNGSLMNSLKNLVEERGMNSNVVFHGDVSDVYSVMRDWELFVYATTPREGLGGTIPEALSMGLPVVATDLPMIREWDRSGKYIAYCKPGDPEGMALAIKQLLDDLTRRKEIHTEAPVYIQTHFSPEIFSYNYILNE